jgi:tetratricopeptide (TPR) repeat protein
MKRIRPAYQDHYALALIMIGVVGDIIAGLLLLGDQIWQGITLHIAAYLIWMIGLIILDAQQRRTAEFTARDRRANPLNGKITLAILIGAFLFPGLGSFGFTLAAAITPFFRAQKREEMNADALLFADPLSEVRMTAISSTPPLSELEVRPLEDILSSADSTMKRAALDLICRQAGPRAMSLASSLLGDPDPDVRALAAAGLSRLDADFGTRLKSADSRIENEPHIAQHHADLGQLYSEYASAFSGSPMSQAFYLARARTAYERAIDLEPQQPEFLIGLAEVLTRLGDQHTAQELAERAIALSPENASGYLLAMETALAQGQLGRVARYAETAARLLPETDPALPLAHWWLEAASLNKTGAS